MARTHLSRHELKETDQIRDTIDTVGKRILKRKKEVLMGLGGIVVLLLAVAGWWTYSSGQQAAAQADLGVVVRTLNDTENLKSDQERFQKVITEAQRVASAHRGDRFGYMAQYFEAVAHIGLGDHAKALPILESVASAADGDVRAMALAARAGSLQAQGETQKAIDVYKELLNTPYPKAPVLLELGKLHENTQRTNEAKEYYQRLNSEYGDSAFNQDVTQALKRLGVTPEPPKPAGEGSPK